MSAAVVAEAKAMPSALGEQALVPPPRVLAAWPGLGGMWKAAPDDFVVEELPAYLPCGKGEHLYLWLEKRDVAAPTLLRTLGHLLQLAERDIGVAGSKDKLALTRQWLSVPAAAATLLRTATTERALGEAGIRVLHAALHGNKLRTGHLRGNRFTLRLRGVDAGLAAQHLTPMLQAVRQRGMANFYGPQRFGPRGQNVVRALDWLQGSGRAPGRGLQKRFLASALQSFVFNEVLRARLARGLWNVVLPGDILLLERNGAPFRSEAGAEVENARRYAAQEVVPTGPMWPAAPSRRDPTDAALALEQEVLGSLQLTPAVFGRAGALAQGARRPLCVFLRDLTATWEQADGAQVLALQFSLPPGAYASVVVHELTGSWTAAGPLPDG